MPRRRSASITDEPGTNHRNPARVRFAALIHHAMLSSLLFGIPAVLILTIWFGNRSLHLLWFPFGVIFLALLRALTCVRAKCCICNQPLFLSRPVGRSRNAPVYPPMGVHGTAALLAMVAHSIRCPYCGRVNRLSGR